MPYHAALLLTEVGMDVDLLKMLLPVLGGLLGALGGIFSFVNGRLNEAKTDEAKHAVRQKTSEWIATGLIMVGAALASFAQMFGVACVLYFVAFIIQTCLFVSRRGAASRGEIVMYSLQTAIFFSVLVASFTFSMLIRIISVQESMLDAQVKIVDSLEAKPRP